MADQSSYPISRRAIIDTLHEALLRCPTVWAAYLGGSDATGRTDRYSDIDLVVIVARGAVESTIEEVHGALRTLSPVRHRWRVPEPTWHGHTQEFLSLADADPAHLVDLLVQEPTGGQRLLEEQRHGRAQVLFDRAGLVHPQPVDTAALARARDHRLDTLRHRFPLFQTLVTRAVRRGRIAEAAVAYQDHSLRPLIELLRIRHCPARFDFGVRYLDRDLPEQLNAQVQALALPTTLEDIEVFRDRVQVLFEQTLAELPG